MGKHAECISGMHFNYSFQSRKVWQQLGNGFNKKSAVLFGVARKIFCATSGKQTFLLGASPIADKTISIASR